jgi:hypothetical protein
MKKIILAAIAAASSVLVQPANAEFASPAYIQQIDSSRLPTISTSQIVGPLVELASALPKAPAGSGSLGLVFQDGNFNSGVIAQQGLGNLALIRQVGAYNTANIQQFGNGHRALVFQQGRGNVAIIRQR